MVVTQQQRTVAHNVVHVLVAIDVPLARAGRAFDVDRVGLHVADVVSDSAGNHLFSSGVESLGAGRPPGVLFAYACCL